jgi:hypothetical protein
MSAANEFFKRHFLDTHTCDECNRHFPLHVLINIDSPFPEIAGKYCMICYHKIYDQIGFCDECGNEYPKKRLYKNLFDKSIVCEGCLQSEQNSEGNL